MTFTSSPYQSIPSKLKHIKKWPKKRVSDFEQTKTKKAIVIYIRSHTKCIEQTHIALVIDVGSCSEQQLNKFDLSWSSSQCQRGFPTLSTTHSRVNKWQKINISELKKSTSVNFVCSFNIGTQRQKKCNHIYVSCFRCRQQRSISKITVPVLHLVLLLQPWRIKSQFSLNFLQCHRENVNVNHWNHADSIYVPKEGKKSTKLNE